VSGDESAREKTGCNQRLGEKPEHKHPRTHAEDAKVILKSIKVL
jgi:hypothetical protein